MANRKISELQSRTPALSDLMLVGDPSSGYSYKCTVTALATIIETDIADGFVTIGTTQTISGAKTFSNNLTLTSVANATTTQTKFLTLNASNVVNYRTGAEVLADIGGQGSITLTTLGTGGVATLVGNTLNIPQYQGALTNPVTGTGTTNYVTKWTSLSAVGNSQIIDNGTAIGIGTAPSNAYKLSVAGIYRGVGVGNAARIELYDTQSGGATFFISPQESLGVTSLGTYGAFPILFITNATERIRIASAGDVTISTIANATVDTDKFLVSDSGIIKYRTGAEVLSDIGAASSSSISGTTNYIPKFTSSSAIGNSLLYDNGTNIGFGTTNPTAGRLQINGTSTTTIAHFQLIDGTQTLANSFITNFRNANDGDGRYSLSSWQVQNGIGNDQIGFIGVQSNTGAANYTPNLIFGQKTGASSYSERMRLDASGNLGINNSSPAAKLDVQGSSSDQIRLRTAATEYYSIGRNASTGFLDFYGSQSGYVGYVWGGVNGERMRLDASGNLGLGVTPSAWASGYTALQVKNSGFMSNDGNLWMYANGYFDGSSNKYIQNGYASRYYQYNSGHYWDIAPSGTAGNAISFTQAMTLDASGRLGIGQTSPTFLLDLYRASNAIIRVLDGGTNNSLIMQAGSGTGMKITGYNYTTSTAVPVYISVDGANTILQSGGGNVGIGTTSPDVLLHVAGTIGTVKIASSSTTAGNYPYLDFNHAGNDAFRIGGGDGLRFLSSAATERMRITSAGRVGIGTSTPGSKLSVVGLPTSSTGLSAGDIWNDSGTLKIV